ncbi:MAG TPA: YidC/Oxa1 family membrane protein insertase [Chloroflexia bacterium]|nr:YidC/Oxa1 family membrane protein insertase [Chloroflexia bacterium]
MIPGWQQFVEILAQILQFINQSVGYNPGLAIIIFTLLVKVATLPLTLKSVKSMREMQRIQPLIKEVAKRFKDDKPAQQAETMRIYQQHGVNPAGSCLPMVIQIPIFMALYQALGGLVGLIGTDAHLRDPHFAEAFLWVPNLAVQDPYYIWPVLSGAFQFVGNRMAQPYGSNKNVDPQQAMMNRIMQFMPLYLIVIYLNFAAGAVIYWTFSAIFSALQTYFVNGFGTLPDVPGFKWLPKRPLPPPPPEILAEIEALDARADAEKRAGRSSSAAAYRQPSRAAARSTAVAETPGRKKSFMEKMMDQAIAAQEAQQAARAAQETTTDAPAEDAEVAEDTAYRVRPARTRNGNGNGSVAEDEMAVLPTGSTLPRKRKKK